MARAAALPPSKLSPPLLLLLLLLLHFWETGAQDVRVHVLPEVRGVLGNTVELPCQLLSPSNNVRISQVTWQRLDAAGGTPNVAVFHPAYGPSFPSLKPGQERLSFVSIGKGSGANLQDATLAFKGLRVGDEGNYTCDFATFPNGTIRGVTWLRVIDPPEVSISGYDDNWYLGRSEVTLNCDVRSNPEPTGYDWSTTSGILPDTVVTRGSQLLIHSVDRVLNTTFICTVTNAVGTGRAEQVVLVRESPNTAGAGATGGIIGGIIAAIIATAVAVTGILICRQQRKELTLQGTEEEDDLEGPPSYKPPAPKTKLEEQKMPSQLFTLGPSEHSPLKTPYFDASVSSADQEMPRYHELPTLEERSGSMLLGATSLGGPVLVPPGSPAVEAISLDLDDDDEEDDYLDKINPIYDALSYDTPSGSYQSKGFVMSRAMYV
ncbi:PREDICTED: poliovirus receptor-related protein 2 [Elephantulus edwardii]|uniref:poliovirus receptor-related protein 2 n=1 Tax=Elephantulus edwardii TaxID=28737 RepID=UPI0003F0BFF3|nr:PREDICTED: poliovirus receptor-related protein 2 [Elephantulus edwardii]